MRLKISTEIPLSEPDADCGLVTWLNVVVVAIHEDPEPEPEIGRVKAAIIHVGCANGDLFFALDADSGELEQLYQVYFDGDWFKEELYHGVGHDMLYVSEVEIDPAYRDRNIELAVVRRLCDTLGSGCELAVIYAEDEASSEHWKHMGFELSMAGETTGLMHLAQAFRNPRVDDPNGEGHFKVLPNLSPEQRRTHN